MKDFDLVIGACQKLLNDFPGAFEARKYLDSRSTRAVQCKFNLGFHPSANDYDSLLSILDEHVLLRARLRYEHAGAYQRVKTNTFEHHNIVLPYRDVYGNIAAIVGRTLLSDEDMQLKEIGKYKNTSFEKKNHLFGLYEGKAEIIKRDCVFIVEGQFDVISAAASGIENVVALGCSSLTMTQLALVKRYTDNIYLLLDNDEAGRIGMEKIMKKFSSEANLKPMKIPDGYKDLDDLLRDLKWMGFDDLINL